MHRRFKQLKAALFGVSLFFLLIYISTIPSSATKPIVDPGYPVPFKVDCTAYINPNGNKTASGKPTIEGITLAGKKEWLGMTAALYLMDEDGNIGEFIGYREFQDTGYGQKSKLNPGQGTIQSGECVDLYFDSYEEALKWGRRRIWIQVIDADG